MVTIELCQVEAVSTQVKFSKECDKQMVTVCQPQPAYSAGAYTTVQHCKEVRVTTRVIMSKSWLQFYNFSHLELKITPCF